MRQTQKDIFKQAVSQFSGIYYQRAILKGFNISSYTADILLQGSTSTYLYNIPVDRSIPSRTLLRDSKVLITTLDPSNPQNSILTSVYSGRSGQPNALLSYWTPATNIDYTSSSFETITPLTIKLGTGPGKVLVKPSGHFVITDIDTNYRFRVKATLNNLDGETKIVYGPGTTAREWNTRSKTANNFEYFVFEWIFDVPEGSHTFELQTYRQSGIGTGRFNTNSQVQLLVTEL